MTESSGVTITYTFDAPREKVYEAWTNPQHFTHWWGPKGFSAPLDRISMDVRPGGSWSAPIVADDGDMEIPFTGTYRVVEAPERLAFTNVTDPADDNDSADVTTLVFTDQGDRTELAFNQPGEMTEEGLAELTAGWGQFFDKLNEFLTKS